MIAPAEASANLARYDGVRYGPRDEANGDLTSMYERTRHDGFGDEVKRRIMIGTYALSSGYYDAYYGTAQKVRTKIAQDFRAAFEQVDFVVTPTSPTVAFELGERTADPLAMYLSDYFTVPMPLAGIPAISIPCGLSEGLPVGFQIAGPAFSETRILDAAYALERAIGFEGVPVRDERRARVRARHRASRSTSSCARGRRCSAAARCRSARSPTRAPARSASAHPGTLPVTNAEAVHYALMIAMASTARSRRARSSTARTTSIPTCPRATRSASTTSRSAAAAGSATCASTACTSRRTPRSSCTRAARAASTAPRRAWWTSTAAARRWWRS